MLEHLRFMFKNPTMRNDPFSDFLRLANAVSVTTGALVAGGSWAMAIPAAGQIKFWGVVRGSCWLRIEGETEARRLDEGDAFLTASRSIVLSSDLKAKPVPLAEALQRSTGATTRLGIGEDFHVIGGKVDLEPRNARMVLEALPPFIHVESSTPQARPLQWLLRELVNEREDGLPGVTVMSAQLAHMMFIHVLRAHLECGGPLDAGWLKAVGDRRLAPALNLIHGDPGRTWQLEELAKASAMSRATFASHFKAVAGVAPVAYLTNWRMRLAERQLRENGTPLAVLAESLGYSSESAFSHAFKRVTGQSPKHARSDASGM